MGRMIPGVFIEPLPRIYPGGACEGTPCDVATAPPEEIVKAIQQAGVVGLGGAGFPTHAKLSIPEGKLGRYAPHQWGLSASPISLPITA